MKLTEARMKYFMKVLNVMCCEWSVWSRSTFLGSYATLIPFRFGSFPRQARHFPHRTGSRSVPSAAPHSLPPTACSGEGEGCDVTVRRG